MLSINFWEKEPQLKRQESEVQDNIFQGAWTYFYSIFYVVRKNSAVVSDVGHLVPLGIQSKQEAEVGSQKIQKFSKTVVLGW